jgi:hypothetical protein
MTDGDQNRVDESQAAAAPLRIKYILEPEDYLALTRQLRGKQPETLGQFVWMVTRTGYLSWAVALLAIWFMCRQVVVWLICSGGAIALFYIFLIPSWFLKVSPKAKALDIRRNRPSWLGARELIVDAKGLHLVGPSFENTFTFSAIQKVEDNGDYVFLSIDTGNGKAIDGLVVQRQRVIEGNLEAFISAVRSRSALEQQREANT